MTTTKTVGAVARALCFEDGCNPDAKTIGHFNEEIFYWEVYRKRACAAIKAHNECLMEPSEEMKRGKVAVANSMVEQGGDGPEIVWAVKAFPKGLQAMLSAQEKTDDA